MRPLIFKDITVELSNQENSFLAAVIHLILELSSNGEVIGRVELFSYEFTPGIWEADGMPVLKEIPTVVMVSVLMVIDENERQLLGSMELSGPSIYDTIGIPYEIPLMSHGNHANLIFKTIALWVEGPEEFISELENHISLSERERAVKKALNDARDAHNDFERDGNMESLDRAITQFQIAIESIPQDDSGIRHVLHSLSTCLFKRFELLGDPSDINEAVARDQLAPDLTPYNDRERPLRVSELGTALINRFQRLGDSVDMNNAIPLLKQAVDLTPWDHPDRSLRLTNLGSTFAIRFERLGALSDLDTAIPYLQEAVDIIADDHPDKPTRLGNLGIALKFRFEHLGNLTDIDDAITTFQAAINLASKCDPIRPQMLDSLGGSLIVRFDRLGNLEDLNAGISLKQEAVYFTSDDSPDKFRRLNNLATAFRIRFKRIGNLVDLESAISHQRMAVNLIPDGHPRKPVCLRNLGLSLCTLFENRGNISDLDYALARLQEAINLTPNDHANLPSHLKSLGDALLIRFEQFGNVADIDDSISRLQAAVDLTPDGHPEQIGRLTALGCVLGSRFTRLGNILDINSAVTQLQMAVNLTPDNDPNKAVCLNNLANALRIRSHRLKTAQDLEASIVHAQAAVYQAPFDHPNRPGYLENLGISLLCRFDHSRDTSDIDEAIKQFKEAANLAPDAHPNKPTCLIQLGISLKLRFDQSKTLADIDNAIKQHQDAVRIAPQDTTRWSWYLKSLGESLKARFLQFHDPQDVEAAISYLSSAASCIAGTPTTRFDAAKEWISAASSVGHESLLAAYEYALDLIPHVAWLGLPISDRHQHLLEIGETTRDAVAAAISSGQYSKALQWSEQGRSIVWTQILHLRTPVEQLCEVDPKLADRLVEVSRLLDRSNEQNRSMEGDLRVIEEEARRYRALTAEWETIIGQVRSLPGFETSLRPLGSSQLMSAAREAPIVVLNIAKERCDALALLPKRKDMLHIPLPNITSQRVIELRSEMKNLLSSNGLREVVQRAAKRVTDMGNDEDCKWILAELWTSLVKPVLDSLEFTAYPNTLPRIWWCVTGPLAFLPIHAAGIYDGDTNDEQLSNYAISSYTPTLSALLKGPSTSTDTPFELLSVIQPSAPGASYIPNTKQELDYIRHHLAHRRHTILEDIQGTKRLVTNAMTSCNWLHLACHGVQKPDEPTKSALILQDGHLTLEEIIKLNLPKVELHSSLLVKR